MIREELSNGTDLLLVFPHKTITVPYSTIAGVITDLSSQEMLDAIRDFVYLQLDTRVKRNSLAQDDPARTTDPAREGYFWDGDGGNPDVVTRMLLVTVNWTGSRYSYDFSVPDLDVV